MVSFNSAKGMPYSGDDVLQQYWWYPLQCWRYPSTVLMVSLKVLMMSFNSTDGIPYSADGILQQCWGYALQCWWCPSTVLMVSLTVLMVSCNSADGFPYSADGIHLVLNILQSTELNPSAALMISYTDSTEQTQQYCTDVYRVHKAVLMIKLTFIGKGWYCG